MEEEIKLTKNSKKKIYVIIGAVFLLVVIVTVIFMMDRSYRFIKVIESKGEVTVERKSNKIDAYVDMILENNDSVTTGEESTLYLGLDSDKYVEVAENSKFHIIATGREDKNNTKTKIILEEGSVVNEIKEKLSDEETFDVETPSVSMGVRGTKFTVNANVNEAGKKETYIEVTDGTVEAYREGETETLMIEAGFNATITEDDKLSEIEPEENLPYIEFEFDIDDVRLFGKSIEELDIEEIRKEYDINHWDEAYAEIFSYEDGEIYFSPDGELAYRDSGKGSKTIYILNTVNGRGIYHYIYEETDSSKRIVEAVCKDTIYDKYLTRILSDDMYESQLREVVSADIIDSLLTQQKTYIKCNWSNDVYKIARTEQSESGYEYFIYNTNTKKEYFLIIDYDDFFPDYNGWGHIILNK